MDHLVKKLLVNQPVEFESRTRSLEELKERLLDMKFVFITFSETKGGTELGINVNIELTDHTNTNFTTGTGSLHVEGTCELNYQKVRCVADIDLSRKKGIGHLELFN